MYLQINQLTKSYGTRQVVSGVDLSMEEGEILSLLGPSGCGKTTILRMLAGLVRPDSGTIRVGERVFFDGRREMAVEERQIGMVFQDYALWPHMTVAKNIAFGLKLQHVARQRISQKVEELLELVNLPGLGQRYPYQLSGGQQQRVAVARALATEPRLLLLDEPLSSLDTNLRETMLTDMVRLFRRLKITAINVTHDQDEAMSMSDRILVLRNGRVQQLGTPTELYRHPVNPFVAAFMGYANMLPGEIVTPTNEAQELTLRLDATETTEPQMVTGQLHPLVRSSLNGRARLLIRPENIRVHQEAQPATSPNLFRGQVAHTAFVGGQWRTSITLFGQQLLAFPAFQPAIEQQIWLELPPAQCQILPD